MPPLIGWSGGTDVLFNLNQAVMNFDGIASHAGNDVRLVTHHTGHVLPTQPLGMSFDRRMPNGDAGPCGANADLILAWFDEHLRGNAGAASDIATVNFALENGECLKLDELPRANSDVQLLALPVPSLAGSVLMPILQGPAVVAGIATFEATSAAAAPGVAFVGLAIAGADGRVRSLDDQTTPVPLGGGNVALDLAGVAARLDAGDTLLLRVDGLNEWYAHNGARTPGGALFTDVKVTLPLVDA